MRRHLLVLATLAALSPAAYAAPPAVAAAGGLPACQSDLAGVEAEAKALAAELDEADAEIAELKLEIERLRSAALPSPFQLEDVVARMPLGGGAALDKEALQALAKLFGALADAATDLGLAGAVLTLDDERTTLHMVVDDVEGKDRVGGTMDLTAGGTQTTTAPKIDLNP